MLFILPLGIPEIVIYPNDTVALEGNNTDMICSAISEPAHSVQWLMGDTPLDKSSGKYLFGSHIGADNREVVSTLTVVNLVMRDSGSYKCSVSNSFGDESASAHLEVQST